MTRDGIDLAQKLLDLARAKAAASTPGRSFSRSIVLHPKRAQNVFAGSS